MQDIGQQIPGLREDIARLEQEKDQTYKQISYLRQKCIHDFIPPPHMSEEDIYVCKICGYEDSCRRTM